MQREAGWSAALHALQRCTYLQSAAFLAQVPAFHPLQMASLFSRCLESPDAVPPRLGLLFSLPGGSW